MGIRTLDAALLAAEAGRREKANERLEAVIRRKSALLEERRAKAQREVSELRTRLSADVAAGELVATAHFLLTCVPAPVAALRVELMRLRREVMRDDITVAHARELHEQVKDATGALVRACPHPMVVRVDGYAGSYSRDYDDWTHGQSACVVCGHSAYDKDCKNTNLEMPNDGSRVVTVIHDRSGARDAAAMYLALETLDDVIETYFGPRRTEALQALLAVDAEPA